MPIIAVLVAGITKYFVRFIASMVAKFSLTGVQTVLSGIVIAAQIVIGIAIAHFVLLIFNTIQNFMDYIFSLQSSQSDIVVTSVNVIKSVGVWDGAVDSIHLVLPFITTLLTIKLSVVAIKLSRTASEQVNKIIKTVLSHGV